MVTFGSMGTVSLFKSDAGRVQLGFVWITTTSSLIARQWIPSGACLGANSCICTAPVDGLRGAIPTTAVHLFADWLGSRLIPKLPRQKLRASSDTALSVGLFSDHQRNTSSSERLRTTSADYRNPTPCSICGRKTSRFCSPPPPFLSLSNALQPTMMVSTATSDTNRATFFIPFLRVVIGDVDGFGC